MPSIFQHAKNAAHCYELFECVACLHASDMKQTPACIGCDLLITNSMSKDDIERGMSIDVER